MVVRPVDIFYGSKLKQLRDSRGMKQYAAGQLLGIGQQEYSDLESGKKKFSVEIISAISEHFELDSEIQDKSLYRELFRIDVFIKLSDPANEERVQNILQLYFTRETIIQKLHENELNLKERWKLLAGAEIGDLQLSAIRIGYLI